MTKSYLDWQLLHTFETIARLKGFSAAANSLGMSQSTVSRQLSRLEEYAGSPLVIRETPMRLSDRGMALLNSLGPMVNAAQAAQVALSEIPEMQGLVTISTVGEVLRWYIVGHLENIWAAHPRLRLEILASNSNASLAYGDADVALRFSKPTRGNLVAQRVHVEHYAFMASDAIELDDDVPWLGLTGSLAHIPEQQHAERAFRGRPPRLLVEDIESLALAVQAGLGVAILPRSFAARFDGVSEVTPEQIGTEKLGAIPSRGLWIVVHQSKQKLPKVKAVVAWLKTLFDRVEENTNRTNQQYTNYSRPPRRST